MLFFSTILVYSKMLFPFFTADLFVILYSCKEVTYFDYCSILCEQNHCINVIASQSIVSRQFYWPLIGINNIFKEINNYYEQVGTEEHAVYLIFSKAYKKYKETNSPSKVLSHFKAGLIIFIFFIFKSTLVLSEVEISPGVNSFHSEQ